MKHLYFVRHGLSVMNQQGVFSGITDTPLADEGRLQSAKAGLTLQAANIDLIISSPITRALETATIIAQHIGYDPSKIMLNDHFIERDFGPLEGEEYTTNIDLDDTHGVEHSSDLIDRVAKGLSFLKDQSAETILVVSHGAVGRALRFLVQDETPFHGSEKFENAQVVQAIMKTIIFVTSNEVKFTPAKETVAAYGIEMLQQHMDLQEMQSNNGEDISRHKAEQAYTAQQKPIVVNDDSWSIPGLKGFPGAYMKSMNEWFTADDWLRLTIPLEDRRIFLQQHIVYQDETGQHYFLQEIEGLILQEARGFYAHSQLGLLSYDGGRHSVAELRLAGQPAISADTPTAWKKFAEWFKDLP